MRRPYQIFLPLLSLFLVRVDLIDLFPLYFSVSVSRIIDGDTLLVRRENSSMKLRLSKIDSPEKSQLFLTHQKSAGEFSRSCLDQLVRKKKKWILRLEGADIYGRYLGDLEDLSLKLTQFGCTTLYPYARFQSRKEKSLYLQKLKEAQSERRGLWRTGGIMRPGEWRRVSKQISHPH